MKYIIIILNILVLLMFARLIHLEENTLYLILEILTALGFIIKNFSDVLLDITHLE